MMETNQSIVPRSKAGDLDWWLKGVRVGIGGKGLHPDAVVAKIMREAKITYYQPDDPRLSMVRTFVEKIKQGPLLVVLGNIGRGKTYLGALIGREVLLRDWKADEEWYFDIQPTMIRWPAFLNEWKSADDWGAFVRNKASCLSTVPLLIIDELGRESGMTDHERSMFEMALDTRYTLRKPTVLLSNLPHQRRDNQLSKFEEYMQPVLMSRLNDWASDTPELGIQVLRGPDQRGV